MSHRSVWRDEWAAMTPVERSFVITFVVGEYAFLPLVYGGAAAVLLGWDTGVHLVLAGFTAYWFGHLGVGVAGRVYGVAEMVPVAILILGLNLSTFGSRVGVLLMLVGLTVRLLGHLVFGARAYREVMRRPWPSVPPLDDDDDW